MTSHSSSPDQGDKDDARERPPEPPAGGEPATLESQPAPPPPTPEELMLDRAARYLLGPTAYCA
jgi:hypothetical protein